jgi:hypothetical protein
MRFVPNSQSIRLDMADRLVACFELFLRPDQESGFKPNHGKADP